VNRPAGAVRKNKDNRSYRDLPIEEDVLIEILMAAKKKELEIALVRMPDSNDPILWSKPKKNLSRSSRGSRFRGVSRNGKKWQVQLLGNLRKRYIGSIGNEQGAALIYDEYAIMTHGLRAKTNYSYTKKDIQNIIGKFGEFDAQAVLRQSTLSTTSSVLN
jgi:hypothetical protein